MEEERMATNLSEISDVLRIERARMSEILERLEKPKKGDSYITRQPLSLTGRSYLLKLTKKGRQTARKAIRKDEEDLSRIFALLKRALTAEDVAAFERLIDKIYSAFMGQLAGHVAAAKQHKKINHGNSGTTS